MKTDFMKRVEPNQPAPSKDATSGGQMTKTHELRRALTNSPARMGPIQSMAHQLQNSRATRRHLDEVFEVMMEKAKENLRHRAMLEHDLEKKANHARYLETAGVLDHQVLQASQNLDRMLTGTLPDELGKIFQIRADWLGKIDKMPIPEERKRSEIDRMERWIDAQSSNVEGKIEVMVENHAKALQRTLTLLGEEPPHN